MGEAHARLGPSNHRWPHCPASVREEAAYPDIPGTAAVDGTGSHLLLEMCMEHEVLAEMYIGRIIGVGHQDSPNGWLVDSERATRVQMCLSYIERRVKELKDEGYEHVVVESEQQTNPGTFFGRDDWWGTVDVTISAFDREGVCRFVEVCDYKDGRGYVSVKDKETKQYNTQLVSYAIGQTRQHIGSGPELVTPIKTGIIDKVRLSIVQPKTNPPIRYEEPTIDELYNQGTKLGVAAFETDKPNAPFVSGKHCRWCKHKSNCNEESNKSLEVINTMSNDENPIIKMMGNNGIVDYKTMSVKQLTELADAEAGIQVIFDKAKEEIQLRLEKGEEVPGYAMLPGNSKNSWNVDDDAVAKQLKSFRVKKADIYPAKVISPAQALKLECLTDKQKSKLEKELISSVAGKLTLKRVSVEKEDEKIDFFADIPAQNSVVETEKPPINFF